MAGEDEGFQRRSPAVFRRVSEIQPSDIRVSLIGLIVDMDEGTLILDDGTGKVQATFSGKVNAEVNKLVRVFGRAFPAEGGYTIQGEIIQDLTGLDIELFRKYLELAGQNRTPQPMP